MTRVVLIKWVDASAAGGWHDKKELQRHLKSDLSICESVGMLVERKNKDKVTIIQTFGTNQVSGVFEIPRECIRSVETLCSLPITIEV
jgi:hypothetical protein